jgi:hypothetical protein
MYIEIYKQLLPEMNEFQLREQKKLFERNLAIGEHPIDKLIYKMICSRLEMVHVLEAKN